MASNALSKVSAAHVFFGGPPQTLEFFELRVFRGGTLRTITSMQPRELPKYIVKYHRCLLIEVCHLVGTDSIQWKAGVPTWFAFRQEIEFSFDPRAYTKEYDIELESHYWVNPEVRIRSSYSHMANYRPCFRIYSTHPFVSKSAAM